MPELTGQILAAVGICFTAATLAMIGRVIARRMTKVAWWYEDYFCIVSYVSVIAYNSVVIYSNQCCTGASDWYLGKTIPSSVTAEAKAHILEMSRKLSFAGSHSYGISLGFSKLTVLSLYWRIFKHSAIRIPIIVMMSISAAWICLRIFMITFRCWPVAAYWDKTIPGGACNIPDSVVFFGTVLPHFVMDIVILILPVVEVFKLRLKMGQKFGVAALFVLGAIVCIASVFVLYYSLVADLNSDQLPRDYYSYNFLWGAVESNIAIVSSCLPLLRPLFRLIAGSNAMASYSGQPFSYGTHGHELTAMSRSKREKEPDATSSTHQLADEESIPDSSDLDPNVAKNPDRIHTTIKGQSAGSGWSSHTKQDRSIHVRNDVIVEVRDVDQEIKPDTGRGYKN
ncbi:unnamed protein product [Clonostachys solani]|uniref:Rhodopsin domain-containing protein n=1 Tax=Clonostachys solani TaxID=160281 RepID=A0A9N9ZKF1_9HYPO|nr:unnamed protein product [Clonostachys solani]